MTVDEFLVELYGDELSDMFVGNRNSKIESRGKLFPLMNTAMLYAYATFKIRLATVQLQVLDGTDVYVLLDGLTPRTDVLAITRVINTYGRELKPDEVTILGQTLTFPNPQTVELQVEYKVKPVRFTEEQDDEDVILDLPDLLVPWMRAFVAARIFMSQKTEEALAKGTHLMTQAKLMENLYTSTNTSNEFTLPDSSKMRLRGFA